ncbi:MAG: protein kinase [Planctomycetales bacterium]|nr:protein kinase [Planctomycetales bacterium]
MSHNASNDERPDSDGIDIDRHAEELDRVIDEITAKRRSGESLSLSQLVARYPHLEADLRDVYSAILMVEGLDRERSAPSTHMLTTAIDPMFDKIPSRLGDYQLLRELGRGGMGIVFAAQQVSLNRPVAIKVLAGHLVENEKLRLRFLREAQSAAQLQHPNIVPVYGNGSDRGFSYYAMQLIEGHDLNIVLDDVRRLRRGEGIEPPQKPASTAETARHEFPVSQCSGHLLPSSASTRERTDSSAAGRQEYFRRVAGLVRQIAVALEYAHSHGTIHRDIKPSNLILDKSGTIWITDFGLARLATDEALTQTGDMLGTLRYAAPEQLNGVAAPSCDIYSLGATLYELVTLSPAHHAVNQLQLLDEVRSVEPVSPRRIDAAIPRDLETIIITAMAKDPLRRYRTAQELADDLNRFLTDVPILARQPSAIEQLARWGRRYKALASTILAALVLFSVVIPTIVVAYSWRLKSEVKRSQVAERHMAAAQSAAQRQLVESLVQQARAKRSSDDPLRSINAINTVKAAVSALEQAEVSDDDRHALTRQLRDEAIAALALPQLSVKYQFSMPRSAAETPILLDAANGSYVLLFQLPEQQDRVEVWRQNHATSQFAFVSTRVTRCEISRDGQFLLSQQTRSSERALLSVWDVNSQQKLREFEIVHGAWAMTPDETRFIAIQADGRTRLQDFANDSAPLRSELGIQQPVQLQCNSELTQVAIIQPYQIEIKRLQSIETLAVLQPNRVGVQFETAIWPCRGDWFAAKQLDGNVMVYDSRTWEPLRVLATDVVAGTTLAASRNGKYLAARSWVKRMRVWNVFTGREVCQIQSKYVTAAMDLLDGQVGPVMEQDLATMYTLDDSDVLRVNDYSIDATRRIEQFSCHPDGTTVAYVALPEFRLEFVDLRSNDVVRTNIAVNHVAFDQAGELWAVANGHLLKWITTTNARDPMHIGYQREMWRGWLTVVTPRDQQNVLANVNGGLASLQFAESGGSSVTAMISTGDVRKTSLSPDGKWAVGCEHNLKGCHVVDLSTRETYDLSPEYGQTWACFSPDGSWLAINVPAHQLRLYRSGDWQAPCQVWDAVLGQPAFSPDGSLLAACVLPGTIQVFDTATGDKLVRLVHPDGVTPKQLTFTADGRRLVFNSDESNSIHHWDLVELERRLCEVHSSLTLGSALPSATAPSVTVDAASEQTPIAQPFLVFQADADVKARVLGHVKAFLDSLRHRSVAPPATPGPQ